MGERGRFWRECEWIWGLFVLYFANGRGRFGFAKEKICRGFGGERMSFGRFFDFFDLTP